jgi:hypothetical protein
MSEEFTGIGEWKIVEDPKEFEVYVHKAKRKLVKAVDFKEGAFVTEEARASTWEKVSLGELKALLAKVK